jgi:phosphorylcholine metabolism protein LicD
MTLIGNKILTGKVEPKRQCELYYKSMVCKLHTVSKFLEKINVPNWLCAGTVLGAARGKKIIPGDSDIDLGIWHSDANKIINLPDSIKKQFNFFHWHLNDYGYKIQKTAVENGHLPIDLFEYIEQGSMVYPVSDPYLKCEKRFFVDLKKIKFYGYDFYAPRDYKGYLTALYGPDWGTPISRQEYDSRFFVRKFWHTYCSL